MDLRETLRELESLGSEQTRKTYLRHGAPEPLFGVKFGDLGKLQKRIKVDAALAARLWATGNVDAQLLAVMVADPSSMTWEELDGWARELQWHTIVDTFVTYVASRSPHARKAVGSWTRLKDEGVGRAGWKLLAVLVTKTPLLEDGELARWLPLIEREIHSAKNWVREAMNSALIAIGSRGGALQVEALAAAGRIGVVEVDYGDTACEISDAATSILKVRARKELPAAEKRATASAKKTAAAKAGSAPAKKRASGKRASSRA